MSDETNATRAIDDPVTLARGARILRAALARAQARRAAATAVTSREDDGDRADAA